MIFGFPAESPVGLFYTFRMSTAGSWQRRLIIFVFEKWHDHCFNMGDRFGWCTEVRVKKELLMTTAAAALLLAMPYPEANASTVVASIFGVYDAQCASFDCTLGTGHTAVLFRTGSGDTGFPQGYDTPSLFIDNPTTHPMTGVTLQLTGYQGLNNGKTQRIPLPDIAPGTILDVDWANVLAAGDLFSFDYDKYLRSYPDQCQLHGRTNGLRAGRQLRLEFCCDFEWGTDRREVQPRQHAGRRQRRREFRRLGGARSHRLVRNLFRQP